MSNVFVLNKKTGDTCFIQKYDIKSMVITFLVCYDLAIQRRSGEGVKGVRKHHSFYFWSLILTAIVFSQ